MSDAAPHDGAPQPLVCKRPCKLTNTFSHDATVLPRPPPSSQQTHIAGQARPPVASDLPGTQKSPPLPTRIPTCHRVPPSQGSPRPTPRLLCAAFKQQLSVLAVANAVAIGAAPLRAPKAAWARRVHRTTHMPPLARRNALIPTQAGLSVLAQPQPTFYPPNLLPSTVSTFHPLPSPQG